MKTERYTVYEVTAAGFEGSSDETDDLVFWVRARTEAEVREAIADTGASFSGMVQSATDADVDFTLPRESLQFASALLEKASDARNVGRVA